MTRGTRGLGSRIQGETNDECHLRFVNEDDKEACCKVIPCEICLTFTDPENVEFRGIAILATTVGGGGKDIVWFGEVGEYDIQITMYGPDSYGSECSLRVHDVTDGANTLLFEAEQCSYGNNCNPAGEASFKEGLLEWEINKVQRRNVIFPDGSCDSFCEKCRCICNKICFSYTHVIDETDFECYCAPYYSRVEYDCDNNNWFSIFEPACPNEYGISEIHVLNLYIEEGSGDDCYLTLEIDGVVRNSELISSSGICRNAEIGANYIDDEGRTISVSIFCGECADCRASACEVGCCFLGRDAGGPTTLTYEIEAPNCPDLDGLAGTAPALDWDEAPCGFCACIDVIPTSGSFNINGTTCLPGGFVTPCSLTLSFILSCNTEFDIIGSSPISLNDCCSRALLLVGLQGANNANNPKTALDVECSAFIDERQHIRASSCECDCEEGIEIEFPLDNISLDCTEPSYGDCYGLPTNCCDPIDCTLAGATITFRTP